MYQPGHFHQDDIAVIHALVRARPLATLVSDGAAGLAADHLPFLLDAEPAPLGRLRGHVARANRLWRDAADRQVLAVFHGPEHYISPSWYPGKRATGRAVPTWNYVVVHAHGRLRVVDDSLWIRAQVEALTRQQEAGLATPWQVADAPPDYVEKMLAAIVGIEIVIERLEGKWKVGQNQPEANRAGVVAALIQSGSPHDREMAALVRAADKPDD